MYWIKVPPNRDHSPPQVPHPAWLQSRLIPSPTAIIAVINLEVLRHSTFYNDDSTVRGWPRDQVFCPIASLGTIRGYRRLIFVWDHRLMIVTTEALVSETLRALAVNALHGKWNH